MVRSTTPDNSPWSYTLQEAQEEDVKPRSRRSKASGMLLPTGALCAPLSVLAENDVPQPKTTKVVDSGSNDTFITK